MNEEEAIEYIEQFIGIKKEYKCKPIKVKTLNNTREAIETVLNLLEKKDKIIDEIIGFLATRTWATCPNEDCGANLDCENRCSNDEGLYEECWKMYFERKAGK